MGAAPGWYETGTPGRLRWWDGIRWTEHEAAARPPVPAVGAVPAPAAALASAPAGPVHGWYPTTAGQLRWWDGSRWTGLRVKNGEPGIDWSTTEQPALTWVLGGVFLVLALAQFSLALLGGSFPWNGILMLVVSLLWFGIAAQSSAVQRISTPSGVAPVVIDAVRPLPNEQEGPGAGWYRVGSKTTRWWTGTRWSHYVGTQYGLRATFHGQRAFRRYLLVCWCVVGSGVAAIIVGALVWALAAGDPVGIVIGVVVLIGGVIFGVLGGVLLALSGVQRRALLIPESPPGA